VCVMPSVVRYNVCTAQCSKVLCVYYTVQSGIVCVLHSVDFHCVCIHSLESYCECTAQSRAAQYFTV